MNFNEKYELIDLSQEIYEGMPVFGMHQKTFIMVNQTHEENMKQTGSKTIQCKKSADERTRSYTF